jgi:hypothetical protein
MTHSQKHIGIDVNAEVASLLEAWADRREYDALCELWNGFRSLNGLTDGWELFMASLKRLRNIARIQEADRILPSEKEVIERLLAKVSQALSER